MFNLGIQQYSLPLSYVAFCTNIGSINPTDVFLFDKTFLVTRTSPHFLTPGSHHHLTIQNKYRRIDMKGPSNRTIDDWMESLKLVQENSPWLRVHRFDSFAPVREQTKVKWYVDGKGECWGEEITCRIERGAVLVR